MLKLQIGQESQDFLALYLYKGIYRMYTASKNNYDCFYYAVEFNVCIYFIKILYTNLLTTVTTTRTLQNIRS